MDNQAPIQQLGIMWQCGQLELDQNFGEQLDLD